MIMKNVLGILLATTFSFTYLSAYAQDSTDDQADVWTVIEDEWNSDEKGDRKWPDRLLAEDFSGWETSSPAPRDKASTKMWNRFNEKIGKMVAHELYPLNILVNEDVAVAHYLYSSAFESKDGKIEMSDGRYTDVLIRTEDGWKFLAWHGGEDD